MSDVSMRILLSVAGGDISSRMIGDVAKSLGKEGLAGALIGVTAVAATAAIAIGVTAVNAAGSFQQSMSLLVTSAGESAANIGMVSDGILKMSVATGTSTEQLAKGMYFVESSGYHGAAGLAVMQSAAEGAKTENANLDVVAKALTTTMVDYHMKASDSAQAMNGLIATVQNGKTTLEDLSSSMGAVLPIASAMGISFSQVAGTMDTMTNAGMSAHQASMNLAHVLVALESPSGVAVTSMQSVGLSAQQVKDTLVNQGLPEALQLIEDHVGKKFKAGSVENETALKNIMGGLVGLKLAAMVTGGSLQETKDNIDKVSAAMKDGSGSVMGWDVVQGNFNFKMDQAKAALNVLMITIGQQLLPVITQIVGAIAPVLSAFAAWLVQDNHLKNALTDIGIVITTVVQFIAMIITGIQNWNNQTGFMSAVISDLSTGVADTVDAIQIAIVIVQNITTAIGDWWTKADLVHKVMDTVHDAVNRTKDAINDTVGVVQSVVTWFVNWHDPILAVAGAITLFFLPAIIKAGVEAGVAGVKIATSFITSMVQGGAAAVVSGTQITVQFIVAMVKAGVEAVVNGAKVTASFVSSIISSGVEAVVSGAKITAQFVASIIKVGLEGWASAGKLALLVIQFIASGVQSAIAGAKMAAEFVVNIVKSGISAVVTAAQFVASLIPAIISIITEAVIAAATAIPGLIAGFIAWAAAGWAAASATIAATWPILLIIVAIVALIAVIVLLWTHWGAVSAWLSSAWAATTAAVGAGFSWLGTQAHNLLGDIQWVCGKINDAFSGMGNFAKGIWNDMAGGIKSAINAFIGHINWMINGFNNISGKIGVPAIPDIPYLAAGGIITSPGSVIVGERGPELLSLGRGAQVTPLQGGSGAGNSTYITINLSTMARSQSEMARVVDLFEAELARRFRLQTPSYNQGNIY